MIVLTFCKAFNRIKAERLVKKQMQQRAWKAFELLEKMEYGDLYVPFTKDWFLAQLFVI